MTKTKEDLRKQREWRVKTGNLATKKYEKTKSGFLMRLYRNMQSRTSGIQYKKAHLYKGKSLMDRGSFYEWAWGSDVFHSMFKDWEDSGYDRRITPTVDRKNSKLGYELGNVRWLTHSENSRLGAINRTPSPNDN